MSLFLSISSRSLLGFGLLLFLLMLAAKEAGWLLGAHHRGAGEDAPKEGPGYVVSAMLGLLAFVLGLSFATAQTRFEDRRRLALEETRAIGAAWMQARAVGEPRGAEIARLLEEHAQARLDYVRAPGSPAAIAAVTARGQEIQSRLRALATAAGPPLPPLLLGALNDAFHLATAQHLAFTTSLPEEIMLLLVAMSVLGSAGLGYHLGLGGRRFEASVTLLLLMFTAMIMATGDLTAPRLGTGAVDPAPYLQVLEGFRDGAAAVRDGAPAARDGAPAAR